MIRHVTKLKKYDVIGITIPVKVQVIVYTVEETENVHSLSGNYRITGHIVTKGVTGSLVRIPHGSAHLLEVIEEGTGQEGSALHD